MLAHGANMCSVTSQGSPYSVFRRALARGDLMAVRAAAAGLPSVPLEDALEVCLLLLDREPVRYEPAAVRWVGRLLLERRVRELRQAERAVVYLAALADPARAIPAAEALGALLEQQGLRNRRARD